MSQLVESLLRIHDVLASIPTTMKASGHMLCNLCTQDVKSEEFKVILGYRVSSSLV